MSPGQVTKVTLHQEEVVGKETSLRKVMVITNGHGQVSVHKDKDPLHPDPRHQVKVALDLCRHRRKDSGRPVKVLAFMSTGSTQHRKLEAGMEITYR